MTHSSRSARVGLITDAQIAAVVVRKFTANAGTALPLLDPRKLVSPFESQLEGIASPDAMYWNMAINGKFRSAQVCLPHALGKWQDPSIRKEDLNT